MAVDRLNGQNLVRQVSQMHLGDSCSCLVHVVHTAGC